MNLFERIKILKTDVTLLQVDAIVNAANSSLLGGGGVDGAIHRVAGVGLLEECKELRKSQFSHGLSTGKAVITKAYQLPAKFVIHTVGPIWNGGNRNEAKLLSDCYKNTLDICYNSQIHSIAFPAISTGIYGYPKKSAVKIAIDTVINWLNENKMEIQIIFALMNDNFEIYKNYFKGLK